jgi:hypothetical protein
MARGWESKSVEDQMAEQDSSAANPAANDPARERRRRDLEMQREYILNQRTSHADRRAALEAALRQIEDQLKTLD